MIVAGRIYESRGYRRKIYFFPMGGNVPKKSREVKARKI
jgi:hypothetical protein